MNVNTMISTWVTEYELMNIIRLKPILRLFLFIIFSVLLYSCGSGIVFDKNKTITGEKWNREDKITFDVKTNSFF